MTMTDPINDQTDQDEPAFPKLLPALNGVLEKMALDESNEGTVALARLYAHLIDTEPVEAIVRRRLGREYLAVLQALGMTQKESKGGIVSGNLPSLADFRNRRSS